MICRKFYRKLPILLLVLPLLFGLSSVVAAQGQATPEETKAKVEQKEGEVRVAEEVTVTGSLIPRKDLTALSPVAVIDIEEVTYQGTGRIEDLMQQLPQVFAAQNSTRSNGASGTATVDLRNLGTVRTLSLINGRRMASGDAYSTAADLNAIPNALVKRVDILTGGASSAYGADAVSGVVNFVLDTEFDGFRGEVQYNAYQHNNNNDIAQSISTAKGFNVPSGSTWDNGGVSLSMAVGGKLDGGKGHASAYVNYRSIADITKDRRDYTNCSVNTLGATGPACGGSGTWQYGRFLVYDVNGRRSGDYVLDPNTGNTNTFRARTGNDVFNFAPYNFMQRNDTTWSGGGFARYKFNDRVQPYVEVMFMDDYTDAQIAPSGDFGGTDTINCDNPLLSDQQRQLICTNAGYGPHDLATVIVYRRNVEGGGRVDQLSHTNWRLLGGVKGDIDPSWSYDIYGMNATVAAPSVYNNDFIDSNIASALDVVTGADGTPVCRSGGNCVPWNIFTIGGVTEDALDYLTVPYMYDSGTNTKMLGVSVTGDLERAGVKLPSATEAVRIAVGAEIRKESLYVHPDYIRGEGLGSGSGGPTVAVDGSYVTNEGFAEALVPVVQDKEGAQDLTLELGIRFANYKALEQTAKNNVSYKALLSYAPIDGVRIRGGFNRAVRAPNVRELFAPQGLGLNGNEDICAGDHPTASLEGCQRTGMSAAQYGQVLENPASQYNSLDGGNPLLDVEKANTLTAGVVWTPKSITGLAVTLDFYDIKISGTIDSFLPDDVIKTCTETGDPALCNLIHRDRYGSLWMTDDAYTISTNQNIGELRARGLDLGANYPLDLGERGFIQLSLMGTTNLKNRLTTPLYDYDCVGYYGDSCGVPTPKWRHRVRASWNTKFNATFSLGWRYIHKVLVDQASDNPDLGDATNLTYMQQWRDNGSYENPAFNWFDLAASYKFKDGLRLTVGCNNILDKEPPLGSGSSLNDYGPGFYGTYDVLGRALYANLEFNF